MNKENNSKTNPKTLNQIKKKIYFDRNHEIKAGSALIKNLQQNGISHFAFSGLI